MTKQANPGDVPGIVHLAKTLSAEIGMGIHLPTSHLLKCRKKAGSALYSRADFHRQR
jgi:hypothetical protein